MSDAVSDLPDEAAWQRAAEIGERVVRDAIASKVGRRLKRSAAPWDPLAIGFGAHKAACEFMVAMAAPSGRDVLEANMLAIVRGVCRNAEGPINADGTPYTGTPQ